MQHIEFSIDNSIATVTLNRPEKRNALNNEVVAELTQIFRDIATNDAVNVVILQANGPAFCAGADLEYLERISKLNVIENIEDSKQLEQALATIYQCPKPVIAKVQGPAIAGGCGLATVCDIVVASKEDASFGYSEVRIGFIPAIVMVYLLKKIGDTRTRRMMLTAEVISADVAFELGLVSYVFPKETIDAEVLTLAKKMSKYSSSSLQLTKEMLTQLHGMSLESGLQYATTMNALTRMTEDCKNGIRSFLQPK
jgi:methylglutaconyl-CoA hydratase